MSGDAPCPSLPRPRAKLIPPSGGGLRFSYLISGLGPHLTWTCLPRWPSCSSSNTPRSCLLRAFAPALFSETTPTQVFLWLPPCHHSELSPPVTSSERPALIYLVRMPLPSSPLSPQLFSSSVVLRRRCLLELSGELSNKLFSARPCVINKVRLSGCGFPRDCPPCSHEQSGLRILGPEALS